MSTRRLQNGNGLSIKNLNKNKDFFSEDSIRRILINKRVKLAKNNHDNHIVENYVFPKTAAKKHKSDLDCLMPPRKSWVHPGRPRYETSSKKIPLDSVKKNRLSLKFTINRDLKAENIPDYLKKQKKFIQSIQKSYIKNTFKINRPRIIPLKKKRDKNDNTARPLCDFDLRSSIILQEMNGLLVKKTNPLFKDCSFAFRGRDSNGIIPTHHDAIQKILDYQKKNTDRQIYVAECDLEKFFDTINHSVIEEKIRALLNNDGLSFSELEKERCLKVVSKYLACYNFRDDIFAKNDDDNYWKNFKTRLKFKWIDESKLRGMYGDNFKTERVGVPQGGALSGFFANLVLDEADTDILNLNDPDLLYVRYCDDMIMLHTDKEKLGFALDVYRAAIKKNKLFLHEPKEVEEYDARFYNCKSKLPYKWGPSVNGESGTVPWIAFVGYQIGYKGEVRVRRDSINKEKAKQQDVVQFALRRLEQDDVQQIASKSKIIRSVILRMQGMSVGRVRIYTKEKTESLCWANGFQKLNKNEFSLRQMRELDRNRCKVINAFCHKIEKLGKEEMENNDESLKERRKEAIVYSGKPFSYYNWLDKKGDN